MQAEGKSKRSLRLCRGAAYLSGSSSSAKCTSRGQKQTEFAVLPRRSIYGAVKVRFFFVSPRPAEDASAACGGTMQAAALRVLTEERIFLAEFDCEHVRNIPTFDWAFLERSSFTTFCHRKVVPKVSARRKRRGTAVGLRLKRYADKLAPAFSPAHPPPVLLPAFSQGGSCGALRATIKRMSPFIVCAARNHDHLVAFRFGRPAIFRRDGGCLPDQVKTHPLFRIGCAERGAILPVRVPEVVKTIYFLKKRARLFFNSQNYSIFALDFAE